VSTLFGLELLDVGGLSSAAGRVSVDKPHSSLSREQYATGDGDTPSSEMHPSQGLCDDANCTMAASQVSVGSGRQCLNEGVCPRFSRFTMRNSIDNQLEFTDLISGCERGLLQYILSLVASHADALDVLQETAAALWEKFEKYDRNMPFEPWARKFAHIQVLKFREVRGRRQWRLVRLSDETVAALASEYDMHRKVVELRERALIQCVKELSVEDCELLHRRYWQEASLRDEARTGEKSEHQLYRRLGRIRFQLRKCIDFTIVNEEV